MRNLIFLSLCMIAFTACNKSSERIDSNVCPPELAGKWIRGEFDMTGFDTYTGDTIVNAAYTTGAMEFFDDGTFNSYSAFFPTDPKEGCNAQVFSQYSGSADHSQSGRAVLTYTSGKVRKFYQQCPGKTNTQMTLTANDVTGPLTIYWNIETQSGKTLLAIRYEQPTNPKLYFEKADW
ncbi:hypothetical protein KJS94_15295 [Flavihumibacter rivuli]|uniref:hypothetical protein n=1 Tax=Flavihumibacter rivuli TaxID=2838156 RepID=UPI001BDF3E26|nr:hypothetical protein [Flavihumibacter rivuli]ULQ56013.1 hypothetical protein KJS94_15295 [Flavihumibacter rivuli]